MRRGLQEAVDQRNRLAALLRNNSGPRRRGRREHTVETDDVLAWSRDEREQLRYELCGREDQRLGAVRPPPLEPQATLPSGRAISRSAAIGGRAR
jgi:hypothetical protein